MKPGIYYDNEVDLVVEISPMDTFWVWVEFENGKGQSPACTWGDSIEAGSVVYLGEL